MINYLKIGLQKEKDKYMKRFKNKVVLITGSSRGIGKDTAIQFAEEGAAVIVNYFHSKKEADLVVSEIQTLGSKAIAIKCDVSKEDQVIKMINMGLTQFGKIDILVNNAGIAKDIPILEREVEDWEETLNTNLLGQFLCIKHVANQMLKNKYGKIINISSTSAIYSFNSDIVDYDISKAGVIALTKNFAKALAPNIQVNAVAPGWVNTEINSGLPEEFIKNEIENIYLKRIAQPKEISNVILFLASDEASFVNGTTLVVDGGHN